MRRQTLLTLALALLVAPVPASAMGGEASPESDAWDPQSVRAPDENPGVHRVSVNRSAASQRCSADALPAAERARMQIEYRRRVRVHGKASADAWVGDQGRRFHQQLVAEGICPARTEQGRRTAMTAQRPAERRAVRGKDGRPCKRTRLENRNIANLGGGAMSMVLVPVCAD